MNFLLCLIAVGGVAALVLLRLWLVLCFRKGGIPTASVRVLVVAGSGGHTTEILRLLGSLSKDYNPRHYVLADTDKMSAVKIRLFEEKRAERDSESLDHRFRAEKDLRSQCNTILQLEKVRPEIMSVLPKVIQGSVAESGYEPRSSDSRAASLKMNIEHQYNPQNLFSDYI